MEFRAPIDALKMWFCFYLFFVFVTIRVSIPIQMISQQVQILHFDKNINKYQRTVYKHILDNHRQEL
jgi:hypothetical protein